MGPAIIPVIVGVASTGLLAAPATIGAAIGISAGWVTAIGVGLSVLSTLTGFLLQQQPPKPQFEDGSQSIKQAIPPRIRAYGIYRRGEDFMYYDTNDTGDLISLGAHCAHQIDSILENWLNDRIVELDPSDGGVTTDNWEHLGTSYVFIKNYLGTPDQVVADMPGEWDPLKHKGHGIAMSWMKCSDASAEDQQKVFPQGPPSHRVTFKGALIYDPRDFTQTVGIEVSYKWSDNAALIILDYLTRTEWSTSGPIPVGFGIEWGEIDVDSFIEAADRCDDDIPLKEGGTEKRWRLWGAYEMNEDRKRVLQDMLDCCGGRLITTPSGKLGLSVGVPGPSPTVVIEDQNIRNYSLDQGLPPTDRINEIRVTFISRLQDWNETEAGIQVDQPSIDRNGVQSSASKLRFCPSDGQAQRVGRYLLRRGNPTCAGAITGDLALLDAWGERWMRLRSDELDYDVICEIKTMRINRGDLSVPITIDIEFISYDDWWEWDAPVDQQAPAAPPPRTPRPSTLPPPFGVEAEIETRQLDVNTSYAVGIVTWMPSPRPNLTGEGRWRLVGATDWVLVPVPAGQLRFETGVLEDNKDYEVQVRWRGPRNTFSAWAPQPPIEINALADPTPPDPPLGLTAEYDDVTNHTTLTVSAPNDPHFASLFFYRNSINDFSTALQIAGPFYGAPGVTCIYVDTPPDVGDWYYWAAARNRSNVLGAPSAAAWIGIPALVPSIASPSATIGNANPWVSGSSPSPGATIRVYVDGVLNATTTAVSTAWAVQLTGLALGARAVVATADIDGNESAPSVGITLTRVWYDPDAVIEIDFKGMRYRIAGVETNAAVSGWGGCFDVLSTPDQIFDRGDGKLRRTAANAMPVGLTRLKAQRTATNRNTNHNANPALGTSVNLTKTGDAASTIGAVNDAAELALGCFVDASMTGVFTVGTAILIDTTACVADTLVTIGGTVAAAASAHSFQLCARCTGSFTVETKPSVGSPVTLISIPTTAHYDRFKVENYIPPNAADQVALRIPAGRQVYFNLNQLENSTRASGPVVIAGASASRAAPNVRRTLTNGVDFNQTEGYFGQLMAMSAGNTANGVISTQIDATHIYYTQYLPPSTIRGGAAQPATVLLDKTGQVLTADHQMVHGYKLNDVAFSVDGSAALTSSSFTPPTGSWQLHLMTSANGLAGDVERVKIGMTKPTNTVIERMAGWVIT